MVRKLNILETENVNYIESELEKLYNKKSSIESEIQYFRNELENELKKAERKDGKKYCSKNWLLVRSEQRKVRKLSITKLKQYVTDEIIDRCCSVTYSKNQGLIKKPK